MNATKSGADNSKIITIKRASRLLCLLAINLLFAASGASGIDFSKIESPITLQIHGADLRDPAAIYNNGVMHLFYTLIRRESDGNKYLYTAVSKSTDLVHWSEPRILTRKDQRLNLCSPGDIVKFGPDWVLCVSSYPVSPGEKFANDTARLWIMRSRDLENWTQPEILKVKGPGVPVSHMGRMIDPYLVQDKDDPQKWWCFFKQQGASMSWSKDLKVWHYQGHVRAGENVCVLVENGEYVMFHSPRNGIGIKHSKNLISWTDDRVLTLGQKNWEWAKKRLTASFVLDLRNQPGIGKYIMFFHGESEHEGVRLGMAWSDDLEHWNWGGKTAADTEGVVEADSGESAAPETSSPEISPVGSGSSLPLLPSTLPNFTPNF